MLRVVTFLLSAALLACGPIALDGEADTAEQKEASTVEGEAQEFLDAHNEIRAGVGVAPLAYDDGVEASALGWATELAADDCAFEHEDQSDYGENLWWSSYAPTPTEVVEGWASEVEFYDYDTNKCDRGKSCGHYTQVVWADSEVVGCGKGSCSNGAAIWACRYDPPGNWVGEKPY
ncbi:MAG: pathogenesis-related family 1 protein [Deltaproteobacteria bacterium]|nr:pathogenesis-related family 1 protein [Deltaproteobacteria bacterium]